MLNVIMESGMNFIADNTFHIERSPLHTNIGESIRTVEFIRVKGDKLIFLEAKTAFPKPGINPSAENPGKFAIVLKEICEKFIHSLNIYSSIKVGVSGTKLPEKFSPPDNVTLVFILVVKNHEIEWCRSIKAALVKILPSYLCRIWKPAVYVINYNTAIKYELAFMREENGNG